MNKYFVFDTGVLSPQGMDNVKLHLCKIQKDTEHNPMFTEEFFANPPKKWEVRYDNGYPNVIYDPKYQIYRLYYTLCSYDDDSASASQKERVKRAYRPKRNRIISLGYAESRDGVHWEKPKLGLVEFEGSTDNNLLFRYAHGTGIFLDEEEKDPQKRYKLVTKVEYPGGYAYMAVNFSEDGVHFGPMRPWPRYNPPADSHNFPLRDKKDGKFKLFTRTWMNGMRIEVMSESADFINWSEPVEVLRGEGFSDQIYSMPVFQYEGLYIGLPSVFHEGDRSAPDFDTVDLGLAYSTDCLHFNRVVKAEYLLDRGAGHYPDGEFDCGCIYAAAPVEIDGKLYIYYMGGNGQHTNFRRTSFGRGYLEKDKFAYYEAASGEKESMLATANFHIYGEELRILCDLEEDGSLEAAIFDRWNGKAYEGFDYGDCRMERGEDGWISLRFAKDYLCLGTEPACIKLRFKKARIYALGGDLENISKSYGPIVAWP